MFQVLKDPAIFASIRSLPPRPPLCFSRGKFRGYLDNIMATVKQDFVDYITRHDFQPEQANEVSTKLLAIDTTPVKDFVGYFSGHQEGPTVYKFWSSIAEWRAKGSYLAKLRDMLLTLQDNEATARERESLILDNRVDNPIDRKTHDTLTKV